MVAFHGCFCEEKFTMKVSGKNAADYPPVHSISCQKVQVLICGGVVSCFIRPAAILIDYPPLPLKVIEKNGITICKSGGHHRRLLLALRERPQSECEIIDTFYITQVTLQDEEINLYQRTENQRLFLM